MKSNLVTFNEYAQSANDDIVVHCGHNKYKKVCAHCNKLVAPGEGELFLDEAYGNWLVVHTADCSKPAEPPAIFHPALWGVLMTLFIYVMCII